MSFVIWYGLGCVSAMATTLSVAVFKREAHGMTRTAVAVLIVVAGAAWPLLIVAMVETLVALGLVKAAGALRPRVNAEVQSPELPELAHADLVASA
jgi:hypothetical protein